MELPVVYRCLDEPKGRITALIPRRAAGDVAPGQVSWLMGLRVGAQSPSRSPRLRLPDPHGLGGFVQARFPKHSGGTAAESNGLPFSPFSPVIPVMGTRAR